MAAEVSAVDLDLACQPRFGGLMHHRLAELVHQKRTHELHKPRGGEKPGEASCRPAFSLLLTFPFATQMKPPSDAADHEKCGSEEKEQC
jgi:hypothetical protein